MDLVKTIRDYISRMLNETGGMKVLIVDKDTMQIVSLCFSQSEILQKEVFLVERLEDTNKEEMLHLKAVAFLRPTRATVAALRRELQRPRFGEFHLYFCNAITETLLEEVADADEKEVVKTVQEFFGDYKALDATHFTIDVPDNSALLAPPRVDPHASTLATERVVQGLVSVILSLRKKPVVRYEGRSEHAKRVATEFLRTVDNDKALFDFRRQESVPLLLILDRCSDPVTPLLNQWTYQAMLHELLGLDNNTVDLSHMRNLPKDQRQLVLSARQDEFFKKNMYNNYGDVGIAVRELVENFEKQTNSNHNISSIEDMKRFVENFPEFRKMSGTVSKHVNLLSEMSKLITQRQLMNVSQQEQELACTEGQSAAYEGVMALLDNPAVTMTDKVRLAMLFALRYEKEGDRYLQNIIERLKETHSVSAEGGSLRERIALIKALLQYGGTRHRTGDLFGNKSFLSRASSMAKGLKGVDNVYTQHQPLLCSIVEQAARGKLSATDYPFLGPTLHANAAKERVHDVIVFIVGGSTYEEAKAVEALNRNEGGGGGGGGGGGVPSGLGSVRVVLGGSAVLNSAAFFDALQRAADATQRAEHHRH